MEATFNKKEHVFETERNGVRKEQGALPGNCRISKEHHANA